MNECQHKGCQNRAERTIWPDNGSTVRLCEGHAQRDIVNLDNGRTLWWTDWNGWEYAPEPNRKLQELAQKEGLAS